MDPRTAVCLLVRTDSEPAHPVFLGTCFSLRTRDRFITAAHCVQGLDPSAIGVFVPKAKKLHVVDSVVAHTSADIAVLNSKALLMRHEIEPFVDLAAGRYSVGRDFIAYGFPEDVLGPTPGRPTPRLFKGHFQRYFPHKSHLGYSDVAGEMSIGCPAGLSGGPVFDAADDLFRVHGVVTENLESATFLDAVEELDREGRKSRHTYQKVINYGLCVMLEELRPWLDKHVPPWSPQP